ncbi:MAG: arsenate reductase ArsC [Halothiobacillaceae bacterium]
MRTSKTRVLFVCIHNSARSQMAEAYLNTLAGDRFEAESAGLEPGQIDPRVVSVMSEEGIDLSKAQADDIMAFFQQRRLYDYVIYVCERAVEKDCPVFPGVRHTLRWPFENPANISGDGPEALDQIRAIRDRIRKQVEDWIAEMPAE